MQKVNITCQRCEVSMPIDIDNLVKKSSLSCINCEQIFPEELFASFIQGLKQLENVLEILENDYESEEYQKFKISFID